MTNNYSFSSNRKKFVIAIVVGLVVALAIVGIVIATRNNNSTTRGGSFDRQSLTVGQANKIVYTPPKPLQKGQNICWYVNGTRVRCSNYVGGDISFSYTPQTAKPVNVEIVAGKYEFSQMMTVAKQQVDLYAPNVTVTYGQEIPNAQPFFGNNKADLKYDGKLTFPQGKLDVGQYDIDFSNPCKDKNCNVTMHKGTLTVLPKQLTVENCSVVYNNTTNFDCNNITLVGVEEGDEVYVERCTLRTPNKNVGTYQVEVHAVLGGKDSKNYTLSTQMQVEIKPRLLILKDWMPQNKPFDGTTKATLKNVGTLEGVIPNTDVYIGEIVAEFENAHVGNRKVHVTQLTLCGNDKDNYKVQYYGEKTAQITKSWLSK